MFNDRKSPDDQQGEPTTTNFQTPIERIAEHVAEGTPDAPAGPHEPADNTAGAAGSNGKASLSEDRPARSRARRKRAGRRVETESGQPTTEPAEGRPKVTISTDEHLVNDAALAALVSDHTIFQRGGFLCHVVHSGSNAGINRPAETPRIARLPEAVLRERLTACCRFVQVAKTKVGEQEYDAHPPTWTTKALFARGSYDEIRFLDGIVESPVLRADGTILDKPGYDCASGLLYLPSGLAPMVSSSPSRDEALAARDLLLDLVNDFPFGTDAHKSTFIAALLTVIARRAFRGPAPLFAFDANVRGSGKTLLAEIISLIVSGRDLARMPNPRSNEECRKLITSLALCGDQLVLIDNVSNTLGCAELDAALTATIWRDRILGRSETVTIPLSVTWLASGNNMVLGADTCRRVAHCRLNCTDENPEERTGFKYDDLRKHTVEHRHELLGAALTVLRAYMVAGRPKETLKPWGSFEGWSDLIRQSIVWVGLDDPGASREELRENSDRERSTLIAILSGLSKADPSGAGLTTAEIITHMGYGANESLRDAVSELCDAGKGKAPSARLLGNRLRRLRGRVIDGRALDVREARSGFAKWVVVRVGDSGDCDDSVIALSYAGAHTHARTYTRTEIESSESSESPEERTIDGEERA